MNNYIAYLHGFASGPRSRKGVYLQRQWARRGVPLFLPDLNRPSFANLSATRALEGLDHMYEASGAMANGARFDLIGSSWGGFLAARWAELNPERVGRLVLLCPGFGLNRRWAALYSEDAMRAWRETGFLPARDGAGRPVSLHHHFYTDMAAHPEAPEVPCPTLILHGRRDEVVPLESSEAYASVRPHVTLEVIDDDHPMGASKALVAERAWAFFGLGD